MDPLQALMAQRQQRYEAYGNLTRKLAQMGEERRKKAFLQDAMSAVSGDEPVSYEVYQNLILKHPNVDQMEAFRIISGLAKMRTADRVKKALTTLNDFEKRRQSIQDPAGQEAVRNEARKWFGDFAANNADILGDVQQIYQAAKPKLEAFDKSKNVYATDMFGNREQVQQAEEKLDTEWELFNKAYWKKNPQGSNQDLLKNWRDYQSVGKDTESDRNYAIYAARLREQGKTPAPKDVWKNKFSDPLGTDYEEFANTDYAPKPGGGGGGTSEKPEKGILQSITDFFSGNTNTATKAASQSPEKTSSPPETAGGTLRDRAIRELQSRGKMVNEETIRKTVLYLQSQGK